MTSGARAADEIRPRNWTVNNFDVIRLFAAIQVLWYHSTVFLGASPGWVHVVLRVAAVVPGVPIFFIISGFLVSASYERSKSVVDYGVRRALRIYPGLWLCFAFTVVVLGLYGFLKPSLIHSSTLLTWVAGQLSIAKGTPSVLRAYMGGAPNGSLWTIAIELGFYLLLPLLYVGWLGRLIRSRGTPVLGLLIVSSLVIWLWAGHRGPGPAVSQAQAAVGSTPLPWLWLFLLGVGLSHNLKVLLARIRGRGLVLAAAYLALTLTVLNRGYVGTNSYGAELMQALDLVLLGLTVVSVAYTAPTLAERVLRRNDISYGIYLYHYVIIGIVLRSVTGTWAERFAVVAGATVACATVSWFAVERPAKSRARLVANALGRRLLRLRLATG
jgi:peptidoglycan/LPS O-acetylase OafA/YrhL